MAKLYVAIVCTDTGAGAIIKRPGAVTGPDKDSVIQTAVEMRAEWHSKGNGPYRILVGELDEEVVVPVQYSTIPLKVK